MQGFWNIFWHGVDTKTPYIEETLNSAPTTGVNDDGSGWEQKSVEPEPFIGEHSCVVIHHPTEEPIVYQREVRRLWQIPKNEYDQWQEHTPGWYHRKNT